MFAIATTGYILIGIWLEERDLIALFGDKYGNTASNPMLISATAQQEAPARRAMVPGFAGISCNLIQYVMDNDGASKYDVACASFTEDERRALRSETSTILFEGQGGAAPEWLCRPRIRGSEAGAPLSQIHYHFGSGGRWCCSCSSTNAQLLERPLPRPIAETVPAMGACDYLMKTLPRYVRVLRN